MDRGLDVEKVNAVRQLDADIDLELLEVLPVHSLFEAPQEE